MEVKAQLNNLRISPKKVRLVIGLIRNLKVLEAQHQLQFLNKKSAEYILKLLNSAVANAEHNFNLKKDNLYIKEIRTDEGQKIKRWRPRAFGRAAPILKRSSLVSLILAEIKPATIKADKGKKKPDESKESQAKVVSHEIIKKESVFKKEAKSDDVVKGKKGFSRFKEKIMQRKTG